MDYGLKLLILYLFVGKDRVLSVTHFINKIVVLYCPPEAPHTLSVESNTPQSYDSVTDTYYNLMTHPNMRGSFHDRLVTLVSP